jgi:tripartite ATP-independent transporter DctM subunit
MIGLFLGGFVALMAIGMPVVFAMGLTFLGVMGMERGFENISHSMVAQRMLYGLNSFPLLAIPFFLLAGRIMNEGRLTERIFNFALALVGHVRGGLGHVNVLGSMIFAGMSGSAVADAAGLGQIEIKAMTDAGYDLDYSCAVTAASATIGPIIPPSIPMVLYGVLASVSVSGLFIGGIIPGILMGLAMMVLCSYYARKRNYPRRPRATFRQFLRAFIHGFGALFTVVIIIGGIYTGIFTPTEAGAVAVAYAALLSMFIYKELTLQGLYRACRDTMMETGIIMFIFAAASLFAWLITRYRIPYELVDIMQSWTTDPLWTLIIINIFLLIVGCFESAGVTILVLTPILLPMVLKAGIDPLYFGVVMVFNLMIGVITPPYGAVLFVLTRVGKIEFGRLVWAVIPWYIPLGFTLILLIAFPELILWLPRTVLGIR